MYNLPSFFHYCKNVKSTIILSTDNLSAWERYERERDGLAAKLDAAEGEMMDTKRVCFHSWLFIIFPVWGSNPGSFLFLFYPLTLFHRATTTSCLNINKAEAFGKIYSYYK
jgi:hypothetical protein